MTARAGLYFPNLNGLRFFAALSVLIYHVYGMEVLNGHLGVILFFVLSGFLITALLLEEYQSTGTVNIKYFILRRCLRIWPLYYFIIFLAFVLLLGGFQDKQLSDYSSIFWYYLIFIPNVPLVLETTLPWVGITWSIGSEEQFYIVWPVIVLFLQRFFLIALLTIIVVFTFTPHLLDYYNAHYLNGQNRNLDIFSRFLMRVPFNCMATGGLVAYLWHKRKNLFTYVFHPAFQVVLITLTLFLWIKNVHLKFSDQLFAVLFALIIANLGLNKRSILNLENPVLNYLGKISYGIYMYHLIVYAFIGVIFVKLTGHGTSRLALFSIGVIVTIGVAALSYEYFEKIFLRIKDKRFTLISSTQPSNNLTQPTIFTNKPNEVSQ